MEIRNNVNNQQTFGMAFLKPKYVKSAGGVLYENVMGALESFERDIFEGKNQKLMARAVRQFKGKQAGNQHYDIRYIASENPQHYEVDVVEKGSGKVVQNYSNGYKSSAYTHSTPQDYIDSTYGMSLKGKAKTYIKAGIVGIQNAYRKLVNPMSELPHALQAASRTATELDKVALQKEANVKKISTIFNEG